MKAVQLKFIYILSVIAVGIVVFIKPIIQNPKYHNFADTHDLFSITNFWNVISNVPFILIGFLGISLVSKQLIGNQLKSNYLLFFIGIVLTGFGSGYYHLNPNNDTLIWDRLPMTISFMSFLSIIIGEFINIQAGRKSLFPMLAIGLFSIAYWVIFQDLRIYVLVQFLPIVLIPIILSLSKNNTEYKKYFWLIILSYFIAKLFEEFDLFVFSTTFEVISGHTLKHFAASFGPLFFYFFIRAKSIQK